MALLSVLFITALLSPCSEAAERPPRKFAGDVEVSKNIRAGSDVVGTNIHGIIDGATITDPLGDYTNDSIAEILHYLADKVNSASMDSIVSFPIIGNLYGFQEEFATSKTEWQVLFPDNKHIKPDGTFLCFIGGMPFHASAKVLPGLGGKHRGIAVKLSDGWEWPPGTDARGVFQLEEWDGELAAPSGMVEPMTPIAAANENICQSMTGL